MASFTTRVELHQAKSEDYEKLHSEMESRGFSRIIKSGKGIAYHLPTAEYDYVGEKTSLQVHDLAKEAAAATGKKASILVSEVVRRTFSNLPKADE